MPQMAPISWLFLFLIFCATLLLFNFLNYFSFAPEAPLATPELMISNFPMNWMW
uniref:ATP synthase complex subunit 8 n=1 Tax=Acroneuria hainana TaxID=1571577 RepID=A0A0A7DUN7_9NEOP|nr:ATP synthase F0 subunit 8 [Acroneuria hainana]AIX03639.1 ATP synthase F0 subunit 8 [Acroneuria hainana]